MYIELLFSWMYKHMRPFFSWYHFRQLLMKLLLNIGEILSTIHPNFVFIGFGSIFVFLFVYIKIKYPFWNLQPIYHSYDIWRKWKTEPYIIQKSRPYKTKFYKDQYIHTSSNLSNNHLENIMGLFHCYYISSDHLLFTMQSSDFQSYFTGHNSPCFITTYMNPFFPDTQINGVITSRPMQLSIFNHHSYTIYYMDYVCVKPPLPISEKMDSAVSVASASAFRELFQTHEYNCRNMNPSIQVCMFKKEIELCEGIIPLVETTTLSYYISDMELYDLPLHYEMVRLYKENTSMLQDLSSHIGKHMDVCIYPEIGNMISLHTSQNYISYILKKGEHVYGMYFFKNPHIQYEDLLTETGKGHTIHCIGSIDNSSDVNLFFQGFLYSLREIIRENKNISVLLMDKIGHNIHLINRWSKYHYTIMETKMAYYMYNIIIPQMPLLPERCFILS